MLIVVLLVLSLPLVVFVGGWLLGAGIATHALLQKAKAELQSYPSEAESRAILERAKWRGELGPLVDAPKPPPGPMGLAAWVFLVLVSLLFLSCAVIVIAGRLVH